MSEIKNKRIPVNIIAGPLGVGKTTMINHLLQNRPQQERWAILVNEYGLVGIDAALMQADAQTSKEGGVEIREVAGGCICCSAGIFFEASLIRLLRRRPDRLLIEPTGLAALSGILDTLGREGIKESVDIRSIICLLDASRIEEDLAREEVVDQVEAADLLIASRADLSSREQLDVFSAWSKQLFPPKKWIGQVKRGLIPLSYLDLCSHFDQEPRRAGHKHGTDHNHYHESSHDHYHESSHDHHRESGHDHHHESGHDHHHESGHDHHHESSHDHEINLSASQQIISRSHRSPNTSTMGWICLKELQFDAKRASDLLKAFNQMSNTQRVKAVLRTNEGWWQFNYTSGVEEQWPSGYRRDSRLEVIYEGESSLSVDEAEQQLRACLIV